VKGRRVEHLKIVFDETTFHCNDRG